MYMMLFFLTFRSWIKEVVFLLISSASLKYWLVVFLMVLSWNISFTRRFISLPFCLLWNGVVLCHLILSVTSWFFSYCIEEDSSSLRVFTYLAPVLLKTFFFYLYTYSVNNQPLRTEAIAFVENDNTLVLCVLRCVMNRVFINLWFKPTAPVIQYNLL